MQIAFMENDSYENKFNFPIKDYYNEQQTKASNIFERTAGEPPIIKTKKEKLDDECDQLIIFNGSSGYLKENDRDENLQLDKKVVFKDYCITQNLKNNKQKDTSSSNDNCLLFCVGDKVYRVPTLLESNVMFRKSKLGKACLEKKKTLFTLKDQTNVHFVPPNKYLIEPGFEYEKDSLWDSFILLIEFLLDKQPLQKENFSKITNAHKRLAKLIEICDIKQIKSNDLLPYKLWTKTRWTDLVGVYVLNEIEKKFLTLHPVALQLPREGIQLIEPVYKMHYSSITAQFHFLIQSMLGSSHTLQDVDSIYLKNGIILVTITGRITEDNAYVSVTKIKENMPFSNIPSKQTNDELGPKTPTESKLIGIVSESIKNCLSFSPQDKTTQNSSALGRTSLPESLDNLVTQILIKLPTCEETLSYDIAWSDQLFSMFEEVVLCECIYLFHCGDSRIVFHFSRDFSLEVEVFTDSLTGLTKLRCGMSRLEFDFDGRHQKLQISQIKPNHSKSKSAFKQEQKSNINKNKELPFISSDLSTPSAGTKTPSTGRNQNTTITKHFKNETKRLEAWWCSHPMFRVWYDSNSKLIKELPQHHSSSNKAYGVSLLRFYTWGTMVLSARVESPIAILLVEEEELKKKFSNKISISIKGQPSVEINRNEIDIAVTPNLERVYLCCKSEIVSKSIMPQQTKIEFEYTEVSPNKLKFKLAQVEISSGAPTRHTLNGLYTYGILAEFCTKTGIYFQSQYSKELCPIFEGTNYDNESPSKLETAAGTSVQDAISETSDIEKFDLESSSVHNTLL